MKKKKEVIKVTEPKTTLDFYSQLNSLVEDYVSSEGLAYCPAVRPAMSGLVVE